MHQIYSCSDENLEVFTTVISSKSCSPARRRAKTTQHILTKNVVAISDRRPHQGDLLQVLYSEDEARGRGGQRGPRPTKGTTQHVGINERESSKSYNHLLDGKSLIPPSPVAHITVKTVTVTGSPTRDCTSTEEHRHRWRKTTEYDLALPPGAEASLPLTGGNLCGTPSLLRKMWMKHKKKSEYLGATNSAFEAD
ncbi:vexin [Neopelma chrysocephalum]|uniref:vexin n=1 Tax=Neopelma chrysocephalum TaxID=114329 RepID=UPI000FCD4D89|nr:vexin [Neopelma chrysocephalum]XP_027558348.1 vexin [Neopelma chrysocephalum]